MPSASPQTGTLTTPAGNRTRFLTSLLDVIEFYATHEDAPVPDLCTFGYRMPDGTGEQKHARVDAVAAGLGAPAEWRDGTYRAGREFGAITVEAHHTDAAHVKAFWCDVANGKPVAA